MTETKKDKKTVKQTGITLVALVITIIVLLILAGVSISLIVGENGIITKALYAKSEWENKAAEENAMLESYLNYMESGNWWTGGTTNNAGTVVDAPAGSSWNTSNVTPISDGEGYVVPIPEGFFYVGGTKDTGIVISDDPADKGKGTSHAVAKTLVGNQFVWVPTDEVDYNRYDFTKSFFTVSECTDVLNTTHSASVEAYGGYYISRYEAGSTSARTSGVSLTTVHSKQNQYPYNYVTLEQAQSLSQGMYSSNTSVYSDLTNSYAWDTVLKWVNIKAGKNVDTDSSDWGNFNDTTYTITGKYALNYGSTWSEGVYTKSASGNVLLGTGVLESTVANNIYDLAGNVLEITTEKAYFFLVSRGGCIQTLGSGAPAGYRAEEDANFNYYIYGFRVVLYIA